MCIAVLNDTVVRISIKFRPQVLNGGTVDSNGPAAGDGVRTTVNEDGHIGDSDINSSVEKRCTLTPLASMSSARCGLGTAVLGGQLVAVGRFSLSL